jgi:regulator of replication initiation timing
MPLSDTSDKHCSQTVENLMHENKLLREELAKSKTTIKNLEATATNNLLSDKQVKQLDEEMEVVQQLYSIDLEHFAEPHDDGLLLIAHGAGKALLSTLEPFGLCKSYNF